MTRFAIITIMLVALLGWGSAAADGKIGLYFDTEAGSDCLDSNDLNPLATFEVYVVLTDATFDFMDGFELGTSLEGDSVFFTAVDFTMAHPALIYYPNNIILGAAPLAVSGPATHLATITMMNPNGFAPESCFRIHGSEPSSHPDGLPVAFNNGQMYTLIPNHGADASCHAWLMPGGCGVASESETWDSLKSLYR